uniref:CNNM transmembrane domain-containing protein n=1 Tax=Panagrolaimus superbus TaxID=310955 RepID=A0A914Z559_9BILA
MVGRSSQFLVCFVSIIFSFSLRNLLAEPNSTVIQTVVSGLRNGWSIQKQYYEPGEYIEMVIFGENLDQRIIGEIYLTDAGRCGDVKKLKRQKFIMIPDPSYIDSNGIIVKSKNALPLEMTSVLRLCTSTMDAQHIPPVTSWIYMKPEEEYFIPLPFLISAFIITLFTSACFSGLNLAYSILSLEQLHMLANKKTGSADDQKKSQHAQRVLPFRKRKILPQAICNKRALSIASNLRIVVILMMGMLCIFAWPLSRLLDCVLGREPIRVYDLKQLSIILEEHGANKELLGNVMKFPSLKIGKIMTKIQDAYLLSQNDILDMNRKIGILEKGYTRVPVYAELDRKKIVAVLNVKDLILLNSDEKKRVSEFLKDMKQVNYEHQSQTAEIRFATSEMPAQQVMNEMVRGKQHLMMVFRFDNKIYYVIGLVTLEDIIEEFIGEIKDDDDAAFPTIRAGYRRDQSTFDWFRAEVDKKTNLNANGMLKLIQDILKECPIFVKLNFNVYAMRALIHVSEIEHVEKKVIIEKGAIMK